jgi:DNA (cytosine-5)-methyltransferase 1
VRQFKPLAVLMENVPDVLNYGGHNISEEMCEVLETMGYRANYTLLNAAYFGVPQMRERMFLLAYHIALGQNPFFPAPTHWVALPRGYEGSRQVALKSLETNLFQQDSHYVPPATASQRLRAAVTAREALQDLPRLTGHLHGGSRRGTRHFDTFATYRPVTPTFYARAMREWPGFEANGIFDHVIRHLPRDYDLFRVMNAGDQYPQAFHHALRLFETRLSEVERETGRRLSSDSADYWRLHKAIVPPYDAGKFPNKWRKMESDAPARTLMAHLGKDTYSHIHYDSEQARTISVREAARLQSFPDGFTFHGKMNSAFRQIGNAVPPLLAHAIAKVMREALNP